jgi:SAM-dependent methyltransferase
MSNVGAKTVAIKKWQAHEGPVMTSANGFEVIDCKLCEFKHIVPIPTEEELENAYRHDYYTREKPLYIERYREDLDWWNVVYTRRYEIMEQHLPAPRRRLLDIGSGPGFFLLNGQKRGWTVKGIEPSLQAADHSRGLGLDIENAFFSEATAPELGSFDAINMSEVLEHIPDPAALLTLVHRQLSVDGVVCIVVPNDFNPFQIVLRDHLGFKPWWVAPPHHVNYFDFTSLLKLVERHGFEVVHEEATFPIDMFLLMGDDYVGNDALGRACHTKRKNFEMALQQSGSGKVLASLYSALARQGLGREIVMYARRHA